MEEEKVTVVLALPVAAALQQKIRDLDPRLDIVSLSRAQRRVWRGGRPLWAGYHEPPTPDDEPEEEARARLDHILQQADVILSNPVIPEDLLQRAPRLRWLQLTSAGADRLLESPIVRDSPVTVTTASGIHAVPISEYVMGAIIAFAKGFLRALRAQEEAQWAPYLPEELEGKTVGILGAGAIGSRVADLARAFGMRVLAIRRSPSATQKSDPIKYLPTSQLHYLLGESDYLVVSVPLTPQTKHMIAEPELRAMKRSAVIVNIARGAVIDEAALARALKEGWIAGAALDVFEHEPLPPDSELWRLPNVLLTPHISGGTPRYMERAVGLFCENLRRFLHGQPLRNTVDPRRGY